MKKKQEEKNHVRNTKLKKKKQEKNDVKQILPLGVFQEFSSLKFDIYIFDVFLMDLVCSLRVGSKILHMESSLLSVARWGNSPKSPSVLSISSKTTDSGRTVYLWDLPLVSLSCTPLLQLWSFSRYVGLFFSLFGAGMRDRNCTESADCLCQNEHINIKRFNLFLYFKFSFLRVS